MKVFSVSLHSTSLQMLEVALEGIHKCFGMSSNMYHAHLKKKMSQPCYNEAYPFRPFVKVAISL